MGKLFFSRLTLFTFLLLSITLKAQETENYYVFHVTGSPMLNDSVVLAKGMFVVPNNFLTLDEGDKVLLADNIGALYEIKKKVTLPFGRISHYSKKEEQSSFTLTYLRFIWKKLWEKQSNENVGVVFRAPNAAILKFPRDSTSIFGQEVAFSWKAKKESTLHYFYLQQKGTESMLKIATNGTYLVLPVGGELLQNGESYRWSIASEENQDATYLQFRTFNLLEKQDFDSRMTELKSVIEEFSALGLTDEEINESICSDQNLCFN